MPKTPPPLDFDHQKSFEIPTKHKEAIRQSYMTSFYFSWHEPYWEVLGRIKQALHKRKRQPTTIAEMEAAVTEEWEAIPQEWVNELIERQEHWVHVLMERYGWSTPN